MTLKDQIAVEIADKTTRSPYRDSVTGKRLHPIQADLDRLLDFVAARRATYPGALDAARRALRQIDTAAIRDVVAAVLEGGAVDTSTRRRCERVTGYCDTLDAALALRSEFDIRHQCHDAVMTALGTFNRPAEAAEVLEELNRLPFDGDVASFIDAVKAVAASVWERKIREAAARTQEIEEMVARLSVMHLMPTSPQTH
jgi:hypothetical protein